MTPLLGETVGYHISLLVNCTLVHLLGHDLLETQNAHVSSSQNREMTLNIVDPGNLWFPIFPCRLWRNYEGKKLSMDIMTDKVSCPEGYSNR